MQPEMDIDQTLAERGNRYGEFTDHALITQAIKRAMMLGRNWASLPDDMKEALEMLAHKMGRILNGDPNYHDSWHDIIGYTKLVADRILKDQDNATSSTDTTPGRSEAVGITAGESAQGIQNYSFQPGIKYISPLNDRGI